jgi:hypothetical protein
MSPSTSSLSFGIDVSMSPSSAVEFHSSSPERVFEPTYFGNGLIHFAHGSESGCFGQNPASPS